MATLGTKFLSIRLTVLNLTTNILEGPNIGWVALKSHPVFKIDQGQCGFMPAGCVNVHCNMRNEGGEVQIPLETLIAQGYIRCVSASYWRFNLIDSL